MRSVILIGKYCKKFGNHFWSVTSCSKKYSRGNRLTEWVTQGTSNVYQSVASNGIMCELISSGKIEAVITFGEMLWETIVKISNKCFKERCFKIWDN